jgi:hypothetical protein
MDIPAARSGKDRASLPAGRAVALLDSLAYVTGGDSLRIFSIANPGTPHQVGAQGDCSKRMQLKSRSPAYVPAAQAVIHCSFRSIRSALIRTIRLTGFRAGAAGATPYSGGWSGGALILGAGVRKTLP